MLLEKQDDITLHTETRIRLGQVQFLLRLPSIFKDTPQDGLDYSYEQTRKAGSVMYYDIVTRAQLAQEVIEKALNYVRLRWASFDANYVRSEMYVIAPVAAVLGVLNVMRIDWGVMWYTWVFCIFTEK